MNGEEDLVKDFDLSFGGHQLYDVGNEGKNYVILDLFRGRRISEDELVREIGHLPDDIFEGDVFLAGREEADTQAVIGGGLGSSRGGRG